jgi:hypothetical protein
MSSMGASAAGPEDSLQAAGQKHAARAMNAIFPAVLISFSSLWLAHEEYHTFRFVQGPCLGDE